MKLGFIVIFISLSAAVWGQKAYDSEGSASKQGVHFEFDKEFVDLGEVTKGAKETFDYTLVNTGTEDIEISYLDYCACTEVDYPEGKVLKPGEEMTFDVIFDSSTKDEEETIEIAMELKNINPEDGLPFYLTLDYHFIIVK